MVEIIRLPFGWDFPTACCGNWGFGTCVQACGEVCLGFSKQYDMNDPDYSGNPTSANR